MSKVSWTVLLATVVAGMFVLWAQPTAFARAWKDVFAMLFVASLVTYLFTYAGQE